MSPRAAWQLEPMGFTDVYDYAKGDLSDKLDSVLHDYCVVLNDQDIVLGRMKKKNVQGPPGESVELVMEPGPSTLRPKDPAKGVARADEEEESPAVIVTTKNGRQLGAATEQALERLISKS